MVFPSGFVPMPDEVAWLAAGRPVEAVWVNELGGITWRIADGAEYVKVGVGEFAAEAERLEWAGRYAVVPRVLGVCADWLHTAGLAGASAPPTR